MIDESGVTPPSADHQLEEELRQALGLVSRGANQARDWDAPGMWTRFAERREREESVNAGRSERTIERGLTTSTSRSGLKRWPVGLGAAIVLLMIGLGLISQRNVVHNVWDTSPRTYRTAPGQLAVVNLPDGSRATLAPRTTLRVWSGFGSTNRTITLDGEAQFHILTRSQVPAIVRTGSVTTRVLGTTFNVAYSRRAAVARIAVFDGKVAVTIPHRAPVTLPAGALGEARDSTVRVTTSTDLSVYRDWTSGQLVFHETPVPELLARVGQWYGVELHLTDSVLAARHITVIFDRRPVEDVLAVLRGVLHVTMTFQGNVVTLHPMQDAKHDTLPVRHNTISTSSFTEVGR